MKTSLFSHIMQTAKGRLIAIVVVMSLIFGLAFGVAYISAKQGLERQVKQNAVGLVEVLKFAMADQFQQTQLLLNLLATYPDVFSEHCNEQLSPLMLNLQLEQQYTGFAVLSGDGEVKCSTYGTENDQIVLSKLDMYQRAVQTKQFSVGRFRQGELSHNYIIPVGLPVEGRNGAIHILSAAIRADTLQNMLDKLPLPEYAAAFLIDVGGTVTAAKHPKGQTYWHHKNVSKTALFNNMTEMHTGAGKGLGLDQVQRFYAFELLHKDDLQQYLLITFEEEAILSRFFGNVNSPVAISAGVVTLVGILLLFTVYFFFIRQVEQLVRNADAIIKDLSWSNELMLEFKARSKWTHMTEIERVTHSMKLVRNRLDERTDDLYQTQKIAKLCSWKYRPELEEFSFSKGIKEVLPNITISGLLSKDFLQYLPPEDSALLTKRLTSLFEENTPFMMVVRYCAKQTFSISNQQYLELHGEPAFSTRREHMSYLGTIQDITDSMLLHNALEQSEHFLQAVLDNLDESVVACDAQGELKVFNKVTQHFHGLPVKAIPLLEAPTYYSLYTEDGERMLQPEEVPLYRALCGETFSNERIRIAPKHLPYRIIKVRGQPITDSAGKTMGAVVVQEDITAVLAAESRIQQSEEEFRLVFEAALDGLLVTDVKGTILLANKTVAELHGYNVKDLLGQNVNLLLLQHHWDRMKNVLDATLSSTSFQDQLETSHHDGQVIPVEIATSNIKLRGKKAYLSVVRDIRERKVVEERINNLQRMEAVGKLTGGIAHDFNNLLQVILMNLDILEFELDERADLKPMVQSALNAATKGGELTKHLLAFTRQQALKLEQVDMGQLVNSFSGFLTSIVGSKQRLVINSGPQSLWVYLDSAQFEIALTQLVMNAADAIEGLGEISITLNQVNLPQPLTLGNDELKAGDYCNIVVEDNGAGMTDEIKKRAFEPFFTTKKVGRGSGLGLSMVYGFVQQSGGGIKIVSTKDEGTQVNLYIPLVSASDTD